MSQTYGEADLTADYQTPRWVKVLGMIIVILIIVFVVAQSIGGGNHGPGQHLPSHNTLRDTPAPRITENPTSPIEHRQSQP